jgi:hypothetical protein
MTDVLKRKPVRLHASHLTTDKKKKREKKMGEGRALALLRFMSQSRAVHLTARSQPRTNGQ